MGNIYGINLCKISFINLVSSWRCGRRSVSQMTLSNQILLTLHCHYMLIWSSTNPVYRYHCQKDSKTSFWRQFLCCSTFTFSCLQNSNELIQLFISEFWQYGDATFFKWLKCVQGLNYRNCFTKKKIRKKSFIGSKFLFLKFRAI